MNSALGSRPKVALKYHILPSRCLLILPVAKAALTHSKAQAGPRLGVQGKWTMRPKDFNTQSRILYFQPLWSWRSHWAARGFSEALEELTDFTLMLLY